LATGRVKCVGRDTNNDGKPSSDEEVCSSASDAVLES
jgi:hypothetical protein